MSLTLDEYGISSLPTFTIPRRSNGINGGKLCYLFDSEVWIVGKWNIKSIFGKGSAFCIWVDEDSGEIHYLGGTEEHPNIFQLPKETNGKHRMINRFYGGYGTTRGLMSIVQEKRNKHPPQWNKEDHYMRMGGQCGQSCPCCRARVGDTLGACTVCLTSGTSPHIRFN